MNKRLMYWRRKGKQIIAEGQTVLYGKKKTVYLFTLPDVEKVAKSSLFPPEKVKQIQEKITRLSNVAEKSQKGSHNKYSMNHLENENEDGQNGR